MTVHLIKMAVGVDGYEALVRRQAARRAALTAGERLRHVTRNTPRRANEVLAGGSIYWVMSGAVRARQAIVGLEQVPGNNGRPRCAILLNDTVIATEPQPYRPFQGWRYLAVEDAPRDRPAGYDDGLDTLPPAMLKELRTLGLV